MCEATVLKYMMFSDSSLWNNVLCIYVNNGVVYTFVSQAIIVYRFNNAVITAEGVVRPIGTPFQVERRAGNFLDYRVNNKQYNGRTEKFGVTINNIDYIVKKQRRAGDGSVYSEYVASRFIQQLGISVHSVLLSSYNRKPVVLMQDFTQDGSRLQSFEQTGESSEDTSLSGKNYTYKDVEYLIMRHTRVPEALKRDAILHFWRMYFCDAILGNRDRHGGNWGYLQKGTVYVMAPIYDNGGSLFPDVNRAMSEYARDRRSFIEQRIERYPASLLQEFDGSRLRRTNYFEYINQKSARRPAEFCYVLQQFRGLGIDVISKAIAAAVDDVNIPNNYKRFYYDIVRARYLHIICGVSVSKCLEMIL